MKKDQADSPNTGMVAKLHKAKRELKRMKRHKINENLKTIYAMIQLAKQSTDCMVYLQKIRINPKLQTEKVKSMQRADLEFYIPQLLSQYFRQDLDTSQEKQIEKFIVQACKKNIFFVHKVWFYMKASLINQENNGQILKIFTLREELRKVVDKPNTEILYIANSQALLKIIQKYSLSDLLTDPQRLLVAQETEK
jgi:hypothetical protein